jgi:hypothetical protein
MNCAPANKSKDHTCYSKDQLIKIALSLNQKKNADISLKKSKNALWESIRKTLFPVCTTEWCWLDHVDADKKMKEETFRPAMPIEWVKNKYEWLSTPDISEVMIQYEKEYNNFRFFGPVPVDCPKDIYCELTDLDIKGLKSKGVDYIGVVFNLDRHDQSGSHWVALYINIPKSLITYYDSTASQPPEDIKYFINMVGIKLNQLNSNHTYEYNKKRHQYGGSECGMYSMNFLIESLKGKTLKDIESKAITDREVNLLRSYLYRPPKKMESHIGGQTGGGKKKKIMDNDKKEKKKVPKTDKKEKKKVPKKKIMAKDKPKK